MSECPPPAKRARLSSDHSPASSPSLTSPSPLAPFKHHEEFWFDDGNVILLAKHDIAFRLYSGLLAAQSTVFASMLASADSDPATHKVDGCLVLKISDTPEELAHFLNVIIPKSKPVFHRRMAISPQLTFDHVAAVVRLAHKYRVEDVRAQGIALLQEGHYPSFYVAWEERDIRPTIITQKANAIGAVNLARLTGVISMLPMAMYGCVRLGSAVLDGWQRDDGVIEYLSREDLKCCMDLRDALSREAAVAFAHALRVKVCSECTTQKERRSHLRTARRDVFTEFFADHLILDKWDLEYEVENHGLCQECSAEVDSRDHDARNEVWDKLPDLLGIEVKGWGLES